MFHSVWKWLKISPLLERKSSPRSSKYTFILHWFLHIHELRHFETIFNNCTLVCFWKVDNLKASFRYIFQVLSLWVEKLIQSKNHQEVSKPRDSLLHKRWSSYASKAVVKEEEEARVGGVRDGGVSEVRQPLLLKEEKRLRPLPSSFPSALSTFVFLLASTLQSSVGRGRNQVDIPKKYHNHRLLSS